MKKQLAAGLIILFITVAAAGYKLYHTKTDGITATGTIEVTIADIVPKINGYLTELDIAPGDTVQAGQIVAHIKRADLDAQLLASEAALAKAKVQLTDLTKGARVQEISQVDAKVASAQSVYDKAQLDLARYRKLYQDGAIAAQQLEASQNNYDMAYNSLLAAQSERNLLLEGTRPDIIEAQRLEITRLEAAVDAAKIAVADTTIRSPLAGVVLTKNFEPGEYVNAGSAIATVGAPNDCWVKIYISSSQLGFIQLGQPVAVRVDSYPDRVFAGTIKEISQKAEFTPRQSITQQERANLVFYVKVKVDNAAGILKPGMPADVVIK